MNIHSDNGTQRERMLIGVKKTVHQRKQLALCTVFAAILLNLVSKVYSKKQSITADMTNSPPMKCLLNSKKKTKVVPWL